MFPSAVFYIGIDIGTIVSYLCGKWLQTRLRFSEYSKFTLPLKKHFISGFRINDFTHASPEDGFRLGLEF